VLDIPRERDIEVLRHACLAYDKGLRQLAEKVRLLTQRLAELEGLEAAQIGIDLPDLHLVEAPVSATPSCPAAATSPEPRIRAPRRGHGPTQQASLPIQPFHHLFDRLPDCRVCGGTMEAMTDQFEDSEEITVVETSFHIALHRRQKYRCRCNAHVLTAPGPDKLIPGGHYSVDFAVHSAIAKFCDHLPLERQVRQMARQGLEVTSQTLWDQHAALARHLEPTWKALCAKALAEDVLHVDETGWRMMGAANAKWTLFGLTAPEVAAYHLASSKSTATARQILNGFHGTLVVDGFAVYPLLAQLEGGIQIAHCWAHADRKFKEALDPPQAIAYIRGRIAELYKIEREITGPFPGDLSTQRTRQALRQEKSVPILAEIRDWAFAQGGLHRSGFGKALRYLLKHWEGLTLFLENPKIPLSNNAAERVLRGPVVGRKNFYGNRSQQGAKVAAILYSLIETAKLRGVDPAEYLRKAAVTAIRSPGAVVTLR
jgi:transposase